MKTRSFILPLFFLGISFSMPEGCLETKKGPPEPKSGDIIYEVLTAYPRFVELNRSVTGQGLFMASEKMVVKSQISGVVEKVSINEGDVVTVGDPLCQFRKEEFNALLEKKQAELREAEAALNLEPFLSAHEAGLPAGVEEEKEPIFLDEEAAQPVPPPTPPREASGGPASHDEGDASASTLLKAATVERLKKELALLEEEIKKLTITAPISGIVKSRSISDGSTVSRSDSLFEIINLNPITLSVSIPQELSSYIDKSVGVVAQPLAAPEMVLQGIVSYISPTVDPLKRTLEVRLHLPNEKGLIREGQDGKATLKTRKTNKVLMVPREAVTQEGSQKYIYVVTGNKVQKTEVTAGELREREVEIDANIRIDDPVVISGPASLKDGSFVKIREELPLTPIPHNIATPP